MKIELNEQLSRFEIDLDGEHAVLTFRRRDDVLVLNHTEVPAQHEGQGVAGRLARHAMEYARENGLRIVPRCPYVTAWLKRHPEYQDLVRSG